MLKENLENEANPLMVAIILSAIFFIAYISSKYFLFKSEINWLQAIISAIVIGVAYFFLKLYLESRKGV